MSKEVEFDAGHRVPNHKSKCRNPHGHRYRVRATISGQLVETPGASDEGMLADFGDLKTILTEKVHDPLDHGFIVYKDDDTMLMTLGMYARWSKAPEERILRPDGSSFGWKVIVFPYVPTAENLAYWTYREMVSPVRDMGFHLDLIEVWETPTSIATYDGR